jgi:hypothetical protein
VFHSGGTKTQELLLRTPDVPEEFCIVLYSTLLFPQTVEILVFNLSVMQNSGKFQQRFKKVTRFFKCLYHYVMFRLGAEVISFNLFTLKMFFTVF